MPYEMHWEANTGLHKRFYGVLTVDDVIKSSIELHRHRNFDQLKYSINDFSEVTGLATGMNTSQLDDLTAPSIGASMCNPNLHVAIVTQNEQLQELARRYMSAASDVWPAEIFPTLDAARQWIATSISSGVREPLHRRF